MKPEKIKIICPNPNCVYTGSAWLQRDYSFACTFFLLLLGILPGIIYEAIRGGDRNAYCICPKCGMRVR